MIYGKARKDEDDKSRKSEPNPNSGGRGDTWTPSPGRDLYDRDGNHIGRINEAPHIPGPSGLW